MIATYRIQLRPEFNFADLRKALPYLKRLGISHLYLSPVTQGRLGSTHGYDVVDHNTISIELGGRSAFDRLVDAAREQGLCILLDFVPNHAGVGPRNKAWQDVLAYGRHSSFANFFDIDWRPLKPELQDRVLLPFLGERYGKAIDESQIVIAYQDGALYATYFDNRYALSPATYAEVLRYILPHYERTELYFDLKELADALEEVQHGERDKAEALRLRLETFSARIDLNEHLPSLPKEAVHSILERQNWRLSSWQTAGHEINYRRFFDINGLVGLRMEYDQVFYDAHRLLSELISVDVITGVRIDHVDGLFDPHKYLHALRALGVKQTWVEKILARGETMPEEWPVEGTTGYEFLNDVLRVLLRQDGKPVLERVYNRMVPGTPEYEQIVYESKRLITATSLSSELFRIAYQLDRISEADYHTRDFTLESLRIAIREIVSAFSRYRTYLPYDRKDAREVVQKAVHKAKQRNLNLEPTVFDFVERVIFGDVREDLKDVQRAWIGRFQQYTAPVAAKGVEDTAFYRYLLLIALNEVGGEPDEFGITVQAFHSRGRYRANRYPRNLLATATHDHKRGEDLRMRLLALAEVPEEWEAVVSELYRIGTPYRLETTPSPADEYFFFQTVAGLWHGAERGALYERLKEYLLKAARESKLTTSWIQPDPAYEEGYLRFVEQMLRNPEMDQILSPFAARLAELGFFNSLSQVLLKLTSPGIPDVYQGCELMDFSLVDPDNRRSVDYEARARLLDDLAGLLESPSTDGVKSLIDEQSEHAKFYFVSQLLRLRTAHADLFLKSEYHPLELTGQGANYWIAYLRECASEALLVLVPRFPATFREQSQAALALPETLQGAWTDVLSGAALQLSTTVDTTTLPLPWTVLLRQ